MPGQLIRKGSFGQARGIRKPARWFLDLTDPLSRGLVTYWPLGDVAAGVTRDVSPYGRHGTISIPASAPLLKPSHHGGFAFNTNSSTPYCSAAYPPAITYPLTLSIWANLGGSIPTNTVDVMLCLAAVGSLNEFWIDLSTALVTSNVRVVAQAGATQRIFGTTIAVPAAGTWHHYVGTFQDSSTLAMWVDGISQAGSYIAAGNPAPAGIDTAFVGALIYNGINLYGNFNGSLEGARIYNRVLTPAEIVRLYQEPYAGLYEYPSMFGADAILQNSDKPFKRDSRLAYLRR